MDAVNMAFGKIIEYSALCAVLVIVILGLCWFIRWVLTDLKSSRDAHIKALTDHADRIETINDNHANKLEEMNKRYEAVTVKNTEAFMNFQALLNVIAKN